MTTMSHKEMEAAMGGKLGPKVVVTLMPDHSWWRKGEDGVWERYPEYPEPLITKLA
jgi:hypothetical protein